MSFETPVDRILRERRAATRWRGAKGAVAAVLVHGGVVLGVLVGQQVGAKPPQPIEYVSVQIVPAQQLGVERPPEPPKPEPAPPEPVMPEPEPQPRKPTPAETPKAAAPSKPTDLPAPAPPPETRQGSPEGSAMGVTAFGATGSQLDDPTFTYGYYLDQMLGLIRAQWVRPPLGAGVECVLHFQIRRDGRVEDVRIVTSSGYASFDLAARRAIESASPLPPLPRGYASNSLGVTLVVR